MSRQELRHLAEYVAFRIALAVLDALPPRAARSLAETAAFIVHRCLPRKFTRYHVARENIRTAFGDRLDERQIDRTIYRMWVHLFRMVAEIVQMPRKFRLYNCADITKFRNRDQIVKTLCCGRPVIVLSGHFGNWEIANSTFGVFGFRMGVVARDLDNPYLHEWFEDFRVSTGHRLFSKRGGGGTMVDLLERRGHLALLGDQDAGSRGLFVPFFGKEASTFKSIAILALQHNAVICVGYARRLKDDFDNSPWVRYELGCESIIDPLKIESADPIREITLQYTAALERVIRRAPEQYFWVHRRWKSVPRARRKRNRAARLKSA